MNRPILSLWVLYVPVLVSAGTLLVCAGMAFAGIFCLKSSFLFSFSIWLALCLLLVLWRTSRQAWRLSRSVWQFETVATRTVVLHFDPRLKGRWELAVLLERIERELGALAAWFGFSLRRRANVFLYASWQDIARVLGPSYGGAALQWPNAIFAAL